MSTTLVNLEPEARVCQGDIIRNVRHVSSVSHIGENLEVALIEFPLAIVLTQDCDLEQDHRFRNTSKPTQDKRLISVLVAPLYNFEHVLAGEHLEKLGYTMQSYKTGSKTKTGMLVQNEVPRYHYLSFTHDVPIVPSVIDFKHYFSSSIDYLEKLKPDKFVCKVGDLFREDISQRFSGFLSRIGLPSVPAKGDRLRHRIDGRTGRVLAVHANGSVRVTVDVDPPIEQVWEQADGSIIYE